ncbi:hypothetical protein FACS189490_05680 [Clostridia bacterium]|nr:hypothetical protein FACS189490_05680 [Clostridia bacterium]
MLCEKCRENGIKNQIIFTYDNSEGKERFKIECEKCGTRHINSFSDTEKDVYLLEGYVFETQYEDPYIKLDERVFKDFRASVLVPKTPMQRMEKLLINLYKFNEYIGFRFTTKNLKPNWGYDERITVNTEGKILWKCIGYAKNEKEFRQMLIEAEKLGWIAGLEKGAIYLGFTITVKGLEKAEQLIQTNIDSKKAFVAMSFAPELKPVFDKAIKPACAECGYEAFKVSDVEHNNGIMDEIIASIKQSKFVIADLTCGNNGAYYEAGYAKGLGREVIYCCGKKWFDEHGVHFDARHLNLILWEEKDKDEEFRELKKRLTNRIRATIMPK